MTVRPIRAPSEPVLCFVRTPWAYFTTQSLPDQRGSNWSAVPYERRAGSPEKPCLEGDQWEIVRVAFQSHLGTPADCPAGCSGYSVLDINRGATAWLNDHLGRSGIAIRAGTPLSEFKALIRKAGGRVFVEEME